MDFPRDSILMSHMGEGNWALARDDRPVRLIKRPLGIGGLDDPPTFLFQYATGPGDAGHARRRSAASASGCVVAEGEILDTDELPALEMPYGFFRPGHRACARAWTRGCGSAARTTRCSTPGARPQAWRIFCELAGIEFAVA